jgi:hypothetical protein
MVTNPLQITHEKEANKGNTKMNYITRRGMIEIFEQNKKFIGICFMCSHRIKHDNYNGIMDLVAKHYTTHSIPLKGKKS